MPDYVHADASSAVAIPVAPPPPPPPGGPPPGATEARGVPFTGIPAPPAPKLNLRVPMGNEEIRSARGEGGAAFAAPGGAAVASAIAPPGHAPTHTGPPQAVGTDSQVGYMPPEERLCEGPFQRRAFFSDDRAPIFSAIVGGLVAMIVASVLWAMVTVATHIQIAFMAWLVGILVGVGIRVTGDGARPSYGLLGGGLALLGCVVGNVFAGCALLAKEFGDSFFDVLLEIGFVEPLVVLEMMFSPIDLPFYALALFTGYRLARGESA